MPAWSCLQFHSIQCLIAYFIRDNRRGWDPRDRAAHYHINAPALVQGSRATSNAHQIPTLAPFLLPHLLVPHLPTEKKHKQNFWLMSLGRRTISLNGCNKKLTTFGAQRAVPWRQWYISPFSDLRLGRRDPTSLRIFLSLSMQRRRRHSDCRQEPKENRKRWKC